MLLLIFSELEKPKTKCLMRALRTLSMYKGGRMVKDQYFGVGQFIFKFRKFEEFKFPPLLLCVCVSKMKTYFL